MDPFTIHCEMCAARLKVRNASAVGQRLACPKCGNMIHVAAPDGFEPPKTNPISGSSEPEFEDIDQILATKQQSSSKTVVRRKQESTPRAAKSTKPIVDSDKRAQTTAADVNANTDAPILPNEQWTGQSIQKRRKLLIFGAVAVSLLLLTIVGILAMAANRTDSGSSESDTSSVSEIKTGSPDIDGESNPQSDPVENTPENSIDDNSSNPLENQVATPLEPDSDSEPVINTSKLDDDLNNEQTIDANPLKTNPENVEPIAPTQPTQTAPTQTEPTQTAPFGSSFDDLLSQNTTQLKSVETNFGDLSEALENSGSSLFEINQIATQSERRRVGAQMYFISKPDPIDAKNLKRLDDTVAGVQYKDQSFVLLLAELFQITGVPITLDADNLNIVGFEFGYRMKELTITDSTFKSVIEQALLESHDADNSQFFLAYDGNSPGMITTSDSQSLQTALIPIPPLPDSNQETKQQLAALIKNLIEPASWLDENLAVALTVEGDNFSVTHKPVVVARLRQFMKKWNTGLSIRQGNADENQLDSMWVDSQASLQQNFDWTEKFDTPIQFYLARLQQETGVTVLVDWNEIMPEGWNPNTQVPAEFGETTVGNILDELTHSMDVDWRIINNKTFEITSQDVVADKTSLEFYPCTKILNGPLGAEQLVDLVRQALQTANPDVGNGHVYYEPVIQSFIAVAPRSTQRRIESVLNRLKKLK